MAEGQAVTYKPTKKLDDMITIEKLPETLRANKAKSVRVT